MLIKNKTLDFDYVTSTEEVKKLLPIIGKANEGALDTEVYEDKEKYGNKALWYDFNTVKVRLIQVYLDNLDNVKIFDLIKIGNRDLVLELLKTLNKVETLVAHNFVFDIGVILGDYNYRMDLKCSLTAVKTINLGYGLKSSKMRGNSLLAVGRDYFDYVRDDKSLQTSDWSLKDLSTQQLLYAALDVGAPKGRINPYTGEPLRSIPLELYRLMENLAIETGQKSFFKCDQMMGPILAEMKRVGLPMNVKVLEKVNDKNLNIKTRTQLELCKLFKWKVTPSLTEDSQGNLIKEYLLNRDQAKLLNNSNGLLVYVNKYIAKQGLKLILSDLKKETIVEASKFIKMKKDELKEEEFNNLDILIQNIREYKKSAKLLSDGIKYSSIIRPTGNVHKELINPGTVTGRFAGGAGEESAGEKMNLQAMANDSVKVKITLRELLDTASTLPGEPRQKINIDKIIGGDLDPDTPYELSLSLRGASIAPPGMLFADSDASGQELVNAGYLSGEEAFIEVFKKKIHEPYLILPSGEKVDNVDGDLHTQTAIRMYPEVFKNGTPETMKSLAESISPIGKSYRTIAKIIGFSLIYGKNATGFAQDFGCTEKEAEQILENYFKSFPNLKRWLETTANIGKAEKYIRTPLGGRLYIAEANSKGKNDANTMGRKAPNAVIQGLAASQIKLALIEVDKKFEKLNMKRRLVYPKAVPGKVILAIHDQITGLVPGEYQITCIDDEGHLKCEFDDTAIEYKTILKDAISSAMQATLKRYAEIHTPGEPVYATAGDVLSPLWVHG